MDLRAASAERDRLRFAATIAEKVLAHIASAWLDLATDEPTIEAIAGAHEGLRAALAGEGET